MVIIVSVYCFIIRLFSSHFNGIFVAVNHCNIIHTSYVVKTVQPFVNICFKELFTMFTYKNNVFVYVKTMLKVFLFDKISFREGNVYVLTTKGCVRSQKLNVQVVQYRRLH